MKTQQPRRGTAKPTFSQAWARTFGTALTAPKANRWVAISIAMTALLGTGVAMAAWEVNDRKTQQEIRKVQDRIGNDGTVTGRLNDLNRKLQIQQRNGSTPEMIVEPTGTEALNKTNPTATPLTMAQLCSSGAATPLGQQQQALCTDLANTELAQYRFSLRMFERAKQNYDRLKQLEDRRRSLGANDYANIQYNTNEVLALTALMDNDRDRYQTYMAAYEARVAHIRNSQSALTRNALKGSGSVGLPSLPST
ncbi:hypothetical protein [Stenotrophomonas sp.]|uniref:hypothetical protein n=1 Tax=Stenotrophomonas sp. TaxID=69392 RepID=UPI0028AD61DB|nr:hypothetical protein [Stenotrophomonas sp.]